jgi:hypothetical protein
MHAKVVLLVRAPAFVERVEEESNFSGGGWIPAGYGGGEAMVSLVVCSK